MHNFLDKIQFMCHTTPHAHKKGDADTITSLSWFDYQEVFVGIYFLAVIYLWLVCGYLYIVLFLFREPHYWKVAVKHPFRSFFMNMITGPILFVKSVRRMRKRKRELKQQKENPEES